MIHQGDSQSDVLFVEPEADTPEKMNQRLSELLCANNTNPTTEEKLALQRRKIAISFQSRETTRFLERIGTYRFRRRDISDILDQDSSNFCGVMHQDAPSKHRLDRQQRSINFSQHARLAEMSNRLPRDVRVQMLIKNGLTEFSEQAVDRAMNWLREIQRDDGAWGQKHRCALTGLSLLAYFGHGETSDSTTFGRSIEGGINFLLRVAREHGGLVSEGTSDPLSAMEHAIASCALGEYFAFKEQRTQADQENFSIYTRGLDIILENQIQDGSAVGAWAFGPNRSAFNPHAAKGEPWLTAWCMDAIRTAFPADAIKSPMRIAMESAGKFFANRSGDSRSEFDTALDAYGQLLVEKYKANIDGLSIPLITYIERPFREAKFPFDPMGCYFEAKACFQSGAEACRSWNRITDAVIQSYQNRDNSFTPLTVVESVLRLGFEPEDLQIYNTTLCTLILETSYRYCRIERF